MDVWAYNLVRGAGTVVNVFGNSPGRFFHRYYSWCPGRYSPGRVDYHMLESDWGTTSQDITSVLDLRGPDPHDTGLSKGPDWLGPSTLGR
jgi:hypothetical protein